MQVYTSIRLLRSTKDQLDVFRHLGQTYDGLLQELMLKLVPNQQPKQDTQETRARTT